MKVIDDVTWDSEGPYIYFTPDCSMVLTYFKVASTTNSLYTYFRASDGAKLNTFYKNSCCPKIPGKDAIVINSSYRVYSLALRPTWGTVVFLRLGYWSGAFQSYNYRKWARFWDTDHTQGEGQKYAIALSPDESRVFTFTTTGALTSSSSTADCMLNIWDKDFHAGSSPLQTRNEATE